MSNLEEKTLFTWVEGRIHLDEPPQFLTETHIGEERAYLDDFFRGHLGYRLYAKLPIGFTLPTVGREATSVAPSDSPASKVRNKTNGRFSYCMTPR